MLVIRRWYDDELNPNLQTVLPGTALEIGFNPASNTSYAAACFLSAGSILEVPAPAMELYEDNGLSLQELVRQKLDVLARVGVGQQVTVPYASPHGELTGRLVLSFLQY